jgi:hypothetical protein
MRAVLVALSVGILLGAAPPARAFCGFFVAGSNAKLSNNASQVAIVRRGTTTSLTMQNSYQGPPESFAMVVPVPVVLKKEDVKTLKPQLFDHLDQLSAPRLVEYWEQDPCAPDQMIGLGGIGTIGRGGGGGSGHGFGGATHGVKVEAQFAVGEYEIVVLSAKESGGLELWLREHEYTIPDGAAAALAPYVRDKMKFFVAKVDITKVKRDASGNVQLSPLRVRYESPELRLPVRLGLINASGKQDLIVYLIHPSSRFEVANYENVFVPTNLEVVDEVREAFASFYAELFDATLRQHQGKAVVTEYAWQTTSCDPCPVTPLSPTELASLGGDPNAGDRNAPGGGGGFGTLGFSYPPWVITRLHTRYDRTALSDDLIFRQAKPAVGGRARWNGAEESSTASIEGSLNNFQARYIIRHYWKDPPSCKEPKWGRWGGPPGGSMKPVAARGLAGATRGKLSLGAVVRSAVPALALPGKPAPKHGP